MGFHIDGVRITLNCIITYFKRSGKMYTTHEWFPKVRVSNDRGTAVPDWSDAVSQLKGHLRQGQRPGLVDRPFEENDFMVELRPHDGECAGYPVMVHIPIDVWAREDVILPPPPEFIVDTQRQLVDEDYRAMDKHITSIAAEHGGEPWDSGVGFGKRDLAFRFPDRDSMNEFLTCNFAKTSKNTKFFQRVPQRKKQS
jgi:hypothetical protein